MKYFKYKCIDFITLKKIKEFLSKYPNEDYFSKVNKSWHSIYLWIKSVFNARVFYQFNSLKAKLKRNPSWDSFVQHFINIHI